MFIRHEYTYSRIRINLTIRNHVEILLCTMRFCEKCQMTAARCLKLHLRARYAFMII